MLCASAVKPHSFRSVVQWRVPLCLCTLLCFTCFPRSLCFSYHSVLSSHPTKPPHVLPLQIATPCRATSHQATSQHLYPLLGTCCHVSRAMGCSANLWCAEELQRRQRRSIALAAACKAGVLCWGPGPPRGNPNVVWPRLTPVVGSRGERRRREEGGTGASASGVHTAWAACLL